MVLKTKQSGCLIYSHVDGIIVGLSIMSFENRHNLQVQNLFKKVVFSGCLARWSL